MRKWPQCQETLGTHLCAYLVTDGHTVHQCAGHAEARWRTGQTPMTNSAPPKTQAPKLTQAQLYKLAKQKGLL